MSGKQNKKQDIYILTLSDQYISFLINNGTINTEYDTTFFISKNENRTDEVIKLLETIPNESSMISRLTINANIALYTNRFQKSGINDIKVITPFKVPLDFICLEGVLNTTDKTDLELQEYHNKYHDIVELQNIRDKFGYNII